MLTFAELSRIAADHRHYALCSGEDFTPLSIDRNEWRQLKQDPAFDLFVHHATDLDVFQLCGVTIRVKP